MALYPKINVCLNAGCNILTISDETGVYDATTNTGGFGAPNIDVEDVESYILTITDPDGNTYEIDLYEEGFPSINSNHTYNIPLTSLGDRTSIEDGYWQFNGLLIDSNTDEHTSIKSYFYVCNSKCCVDKLLAKVEPDECNCDSVNNKRIENYIKAKTYLESLKNAANCYNQAKFDKIKALLNKLCRNSDCKTCN